MCAPDVCLTPPAPGVPVPYVNIAPHAVAVPFSPDVMICMLPALNIASTVPVTFGDDPGVLHPVDKDAGLFPVGAPNIFIDMVPAVHLTLPTTGNAVNAPVGGYLVPDVVNVMFNDAGVAKVGPGVTAEAAEALSRRVLDAERPAATMDGESLFLRIALFTAETPMHVHNALARAGAASVVFDLRGCPGGELSGALRLAADFLRRGDEVARIMDEDGDEVVRRASVDGPYTLPVTILVDRGTASAAEVFAGALQAHGRARLMGERTMGKATAQSLFFAEGDARYATVASCSLPGGASFERVGLTPDRRDDLRSD